MANPHVVTTDDDELDYVEYKIECNNTVVRLYPDEAAEKGWAVEEILLEDNDHWAKP